MNIIPYMIRNEQISKHPFEWEKHIAKISEKKKSEKISENIWNNTKHYLLGTIMCLLRVPWSARRSNQSILEISPGCSLEGMMLKLKLQYFGHLMWRVDSLEKTDAGWDWGQEMGTTDNEMAGWHHRLDGRESERTPGVGDGQGGLACCYSWGCKELDTTEWLNWTELNWYCIDVFLSGLLHSV